MEQLLHYCWKHKLFPLEPLKTTDGQDVEVIDPGLYNRRNSGPDFFNSKLRINGTLWVGNVEIHQKASDWYLHGHDRDVAYNNVVLHVCGVVDTDVRTADGKFLPQMVLQVPPQVSSHYEELLKTDEYPPCYQIIPSLTPLMVHSWMSALQTERLEQKTEAIRQRVERRNGSWEDGYFMTLARNYGFGINGDAFEAWAAAIPLQAVGHHRDDLFQVEAFFMGQAGLLELNMIPEHYQKDALNEGYFTRLRNEYLFLKHKFGLQPMDASQWRFLRLRPQNFPHIRISQLAQLYYLRKAGLSQLLECASIHLLIINTAIPMLFAYGRHKSNERLCDRAFDLLEQLKAENNHITRMWQQCGLDVKTAGDSQALIQLKREYCDRKDCLRCRIGFEYLRRGDK